MKDTVKLTLIFVTLAILHIVDIGCNSFKSSVSHQSPSIPNRNPGANIPLNTPQGLLCRVYDLSLSQPSELPSFDLGASQAILNGQILVYPPVNTFYLTGAIDFLTASQMASQDGMPFITWFAWDCTGYLDVPMTEVYSLGLTSDDGSQLLIDSTPITMNNGLHAQQTVNSAIAMTAGRHSIELQYFQGPGNAVLQLLSNAPMEFHQ